MTGWRCRRRHVHVWSVLLSFLPDDANEALASQACFRARVVVRSTRKKSRAKQISSNSNERSSCLLFVFCFLSVVCGLSASTWKDINDGAVVVSRKVDVQTKVSASDEEENGEQRTTTKKTTSGLTIQSFP